LFNQHTVDDDDADDDDADDERRWTGMSLLTEGC